ncbi:MAG: glycoside hydrolase family 15 protein [Bacteroidetes bacterium]|jgi:GH15 family glucan-1,4-alpha-glucosidase|nr:glycoside hydrolase family 15 protein [Bacteroidota bacterium]
MDNLNYGVIGNCRSAAMISERGSVDWYCTPEFDSSSIFGKLLDKNIGGSFEIHVDKKYFIRQRYIPRTNILVTTYKKNEHCFEIMDFMPRYILDDGTHYSPPDLVRYIRLVSGTPQFRVIYDPKLEYARFKTHTVIRPKYIKSYTTKGTYDSVYLYSNLDKQKIVCSDLIDLEDDSYFLISYNQKILKQDTERCYLKYQRTKVYWMNWSERTVRFKRYNNEILRSALVLKMLSYDKSGAILAALTTSLPETIGEVRNWDYRFCWIRDASMAIRVLTKLGHMNVAKNYLRFILNIIPDKDEKIQIMYGINGEKKLTERIMDHLSGYEDSTPVRVGNDAYKQKQNDIYGVLMDVLYQQFQAFETSLQNSESLWTITRSIVRIVKHNWYKADRGIWELRTEQRHFTFSKVLCWVAVDRAIKIARLINMHEYLEGWEKLRDKIRNDVIENAWNENKQSFTQAYENADIDAANLLMESYGFIDAKDPKFISTVHATQRELGNNGLMYRYKNDDDFGTPSSAFTICTFWLINSLYKIGEKDQAEMMFEKMLNYSNHLGLYSEDLDFKSKRLLGNFPQAYSHLALIETAISIAEGTVTKDEEVLENLM